jgi:hypothetical protein
VRGLVRAQKGRSEFRVDAGSGQCAVEKDLRNGGGSWTCYIIFVHKQGHTRPLQHTLAATLDPCQVHHGATLCRIV